MMDDRESLGVPSKGMTDNDDMAAIEAKITEVVATLNQRPKGKIEVPEEPWN